MYMDYVKNGSLSVKIPRHQNSDLTAVPEPVLLTDNDFYPVYDNKWNQIGIKYTGTAKRVIIPETYRGIPIVDASYMFDGNEDIEYVKFPSTTRKAVAACRNCIRLVTVEFGKNMENMRQICYGCVSLKTIGTLPDSCMSLNEAFAYCSSLKSIPKLPISLKRANRICFYCIGLETITGDLPPMLEEAGFAFFGCRSLKRIPAFPKTLWNIESICEGCASLDGFIEINNQLPVFENCLKGAGISTGKHLTLCGTSFNLFAISKTDPDKKFQIEQSDYYESLKPLSHELFEKINCAISNMRMKFDNIKEKLVQHIVPSNRTSDSIQIIRK